MTFDAV